MKTAFVVASACFAVSSTASAGGYAGLALGTQPSINDDFVGSVAIPSGRSLRLLGGFRFEGLPIAILSLEGALNGFGALSRQGAGQTAYQLSGAVKASFPLGNNFEAFGRLGLERTWLNLNDVGADLSGNGWLIGAGFEWRLDTLLKNAGVSTKASLFVDYDLHRATLRASGDGVDMNTGMWGLGFTVGF